MPVRGVHRDAQFGGEFASLGDQIDFLIATCEPSGPLAAAFRDLRRRLREDPPETAQR